NSHDVRIRTKRPASVLLNKLSFVLIVPRGSAEGLRDHENGTGPYRLNKWVRNKTLRLRDWEDYWGERPAFDSVVFYLNRNPQESIEDLKRGNSHLAQSRNKSLKAFVQRSANYILQLHDSIYERFLGFDLSREKTPYCDAEKNPF